MTQYKTKNEIKEKFNSKKLVELENLIQVQDSATKVYHYLVENCFGWVELEITSLKPEFFTKLIEGEK
jgi:hypothetical protein